MNLKTIFIFVFYSIHFQVLSTYDLWIYVSIQGFSTEYIDDDDSIFL